MINKDQDIQLQQKFLFMTLALEKKKKKKLGFCLNSFTEQHKKFYAAI